MKRICVLILSLVVCVSSVAQSSGGSSSTTRRFGLSRAQTGITPLGGYFALPKFATGSIPAAAAGNEGAIVYDDTTNTIKVSNGTSWDNYGLALAGPYLPFAGGTMMGNLLVSGSRAIGSSGTPWNAIYGTSLYSANTFNTGNYYFGSGVTTYYLQRDGDYVKLVSGGKEYSFDAQGVGGLLMPAGAEITTTGTITGGRLQSGSPASATDGQFYIHSEQGLTDYFFSLAPPAAMTESTPYIVPTADGTAGQYLKTDGSFALSWDTPASVAGADTQIQYNDSGALGADAGLTTNKSGSLTATGTVTGGAFSTAGSVTVGSGGTDASIIMGNDANDYIRMWNSSFYVYANGNDGLAVDGSGFGTGKYASYPWANRLAPGPTQAGWSFYNDTNTGMGHGAADDGRLIAGGESIASFANDGTNHLFKVIGDTAQATNVFEVENSGGTDLFYVDKDGAIHTGTGYAGTGATITAAGAGSFDGALTTASSITGGGCILFFSHIYTNSGTPLTLMVDSWNHSTNDAQLVNEGGKFTAASGDQRGFSIQNNWDQTGTASSCDFEIIRDDVGNSASGTRLLARWGTTATPAMFTVDNTGTVTAVRYAQTTGTIADDDTTPDVSGGTVFYTVANTTGAAITDLDSPTVGVTYTLIIGDATNITNIADGGNFKLAGNWAPDSVDDSLVVFCKADNYYVELSRSNN